MSEPNSTASDDFFIGYLGRAPKAHRAALIAAALGLLLGFAGAALAIAAAQDDPGDGAIRWGERLTERGVIYAAPYPHLRQAPTPEHPLGRTYTMVRAGKRGVQDLAARFDGRFVEVKGVWTRRGTLDMIQAGGRGGPVNAPDPESEGPRYDAAALTPVEDLGRWRLSGEICDGKCYLGAMRPGRGLAHKACANLCILSGAPPVLVTSQPVVAGGVETEFILLGDPEGRALPDAVYDLTAIPVRLEGVLERRGDLLVFMTDLAAAERL